MPDFWRNSGFHLLERDARGWLAVSDDFLRAYWLRHEVHPVEESCASERALHAALMGDPRRAVSEAELEAIADEDARDNYRVVLRFRARLMQAGTLEGAYLALFREGRIDIPPMFIDQMVHVILRNMLDGCEDPLMLRAAELFFREQKLNLQDSTILLADAETVEMHASGNRYGSLGRLLVEAQTSLAAVELDVLDKDNAALYWTRESSNDTVISINFGRAALEALCRVIEAWVAHFFGVRVKVKPLRRIDEPRWAWHIGLDAESTGILNDLYEGREIDHGRMRRLLALLRMDFDNAADMRSDLAGRPVYMALSADEEDVVRMKPQNLLLNLPLAARSLSMGVAPGYWLKAKRRLAREDAVLAGIIRAHPRVSLVARGEPFFTLARSIVGQQISVKAAQSIWNRVAALAPEMQPAQVLALRARKRRLKAAGLSDRKVEYIVDLARHFHEGSIHPQRWGEMDDEAVIGELVQVRGIGRWTAEMFLMFNLLRPDVLPLGDLGLLNAVRLHYFEGEKVPTARIAAVAEAWKPYRSVATWYLWRSLDPVPVEY